MYKLEEVVKAFESWRATRLNKNEPIPDRLWVMVKTLIPHYKKVHIQKALRLSGGQFNKRCLQQDGVINEGFVEGVFEPFHRIDANKDCELTLKGTRKSLHIKVTLSQLPEVLPIIEGYL